MKMETIAAISTPPGIGGIAVVRLSGPESRQVAAQVFFPKNKKRSLLTAKGYTALFGEFCFQGRTVDEGIALCFSNPHSYTGEDVVELSCHGGHVVSREVLLACFEAGASPAGPGEFTCRAVLNGRISLTQAEAVMDLISASSRQGAAAAKAAMSGALAKAVEGQKQKLLSLAAHLAANIDYPEEDVEPLAEKDFLDTISQVRDELDALIAGFDRGAILRRGVKTVIVGSPNVGKSTLFNLLSGFERAIITPVAGTTRDVVREEIQIGGVPLLLSDTAGLRESDDVVEREGIRRSYDEMEQAGLIIAVFDASLPAAEEDWELARRCEGRPALALLNKSDLENYKDPGEFQQYFAKTLLVSAVQPGTRDAIEEAVLAVLGLAQPDVDAPMLGNDRQFAAAMRARQRLDETKIAFEQDKLYDAASIALSEALAALGELTGEDVTETMLREVFSKFCVGK